MKETKKIKKIHKQIRNNIIRKICNYLYSYFDLKKFEYLKNSLLYTGLHSLYIIIISFILTFDCNILHLIIILIIISLDAFAMIVFHRCPVTLLEKKYLKYNIPNILKKNLKSLNICYNCSHEYESQIEVIINVWLLIASKCLIIIFLKMFNIKLINNGIYF
jgi:hypothetical protein